MSIQLKPMTNISENTNILEQQISSDEDVCCSCGIIHSFPEALRRDFRVADVGIIVCCSGSFAFTCEGAEYVVRSGETLFLSHGVRFSVTSQSDDCSVVIIFYRADSIRNILGSTVVGMKFVEYINPRPCWVMHTGHENELTYYSQLLAAHTPSELVNLHIAHPHHAVDAHLSVEEVGSGVHVMQSGVYHLHAAPVGSLQFGERQNTMLPYIVQ